MKRKNAGFTLAELLIVVAIIAVLVSISIPVFTGHLERSREAVDFANVRSAYTALMGAVIEGDGAAQYGGTRIRQTDGTYRVVVKPLKQQQDGWATKVDGMTLAGIPSADWDGSPRAEGVCSITYYPDSDRVNLIWGSQYSSMPLMELKAVRNEKRVKEDQKTLKALGRAILDLGLTQNELGNQYSILQGVGYRIADYYQLKHAGEDNSYQSGGFRIVSNPNGHLEQLLESIGYDHGASRSEEFVATPNPAYTYKDGMVSTTYDNQLFVSDELGANQFGNYPMDQTKRSIIIEVKKTDSTGKITEFDIYTKAMDNQANLNEEQKKLFRFTIKK